MCLVSGFSDMPTLIPTPKAKKIASVLWVALNFHVILAIMEFSCLSVIDGMFDMIGAVIGYCAIRDPNRFNVYQVLCYCIYTGMDFFWSTVRIVLLATKATKIPGTTKWQYHLYVATVIAGTVFYLIASIISNLLYRELRDILHDIADPNWRSEAGQQSGYGASDQGPINGQGGGYQQVSQSPQQDNNFQGTAFKLGTDAPSNGEEEIGGTA